MNAEKPKPKRGRRLGSRAINPKNVKSVPLAVRFSPEQVAYLDFAACAMGAAGCPPKECTRGFIIQKMLEFGRPGLEVWIKEVTK